MRIVTLLATGFEDLEALGTVALLRRAGLKVDLCSTEESNWVQGRYQVQVKCDVQLTNVHVNNYDLVFIPGGMPGVDNLYNNKYVLELLKQFDKDEKEIAAICAGPSILGRLGLLKDRSFTVFPGFEQYGEGGKHVDESVVVSGRIITAKAAGNVHAFALAIIEKLLGKEKAHEVSESIYYR